jgi:beta-phosphoglucomutase-like phosphatase (HAD superfamily)
VLAACRLLDVRPQDAVAFTHSAAGVAAARAAGLTVVGVGADAGSLTAAGADRVVSSLGALLDARLAT